MNTIGSGDVSKTIGGLVTRVIEWAANNAKGTARKKFAEHLNRNEEAFRIYLRRKYLIISRVRNILYSDPVPIESFYIPLNMSARINYDSIDVKVDEALFFVFKNMKVVVEASAGAGKSIFMRKLFSEALSMEGDTARIPLLLELRVLNESGPQSLESKILEDIQGLEPSFMPEQLQAGLQAGIFLILLDGFDEIHPEMKDHYRIEVREFTKRYKNCPLVLATRPMDAIELSGLSCRLRINPLQIADVCNLIRCLVFDEKVKIEFISRVESDLFDSHRTFLERPLLAIMMLITFNEKREVEFKLTRFYQDAYSALYYLHDVRKDGFRRRFHSKLDRDQLFNLLKCLCILSYLESAYLFSDVEFRKYISKALVMNGLKASVDDIVFDLMSSLCLIQRVGASLSFIHRSFQEYFSAEYISSCDEERAIKIITKIARRADTDITLMMVRDLNLTLLDVKWLLPRLRIAEKIFYVDETAEGICALISLLFIFTQAEDTQNSISVNNNAIVLTLLVASKISGENYVGPIRDSSQPLFDFLIKSSCVNHSAASLAFTKLSAIVDIKAVPPEDWTRIYHRANMIRNSIEKLISHIESKAESSTSEIDKILLKEEM